MEIKENKSFQSILQAENLVLVDFFTEWCGPCKMMAPVIDKIKSKTGDHIRIFKVDVDKNPSVVNKYHIRGVPTLILFHRGNIVWQHSGMISEESLLQIIKSNLN
ncbi:MAG: thioredoxin [Saprospiraceae bacterium]|nr:thioredoxin [Saprospiraceae bacterium]